TIAGIVEDVDTGIVLPDTPVTGQRRAEHGEEDGLVHAAVGDHRHRSTLRAPAVPPHGARPRVPPPPDRLAPRDPREMRRLVPLPHRLRVAGLDLRHGQPFPFPDPDLA